MIGQSQVLLISKGTHRKSGYCNLKFRSYKPLLLLRASGSVTNITKTMDNTPEVVPIVDALH